MVSYTPTLLKKLAALPTREQWREGLFIATGGGEKICVTKNEISLKCPNLISESLMRPSDSATGYRGVCKDCRSKSKVKPFFATVWRAGKTKEEAALAYARAPEAQAQVAAEVANPKPVPLTAEEAVAQAAAEGRNLETSKSAAVYRGVNYKVERSRYAPTKCAGQARKCYEAKVQRAGKHMHLGCFATAEEAALAVARVKACTNPPAASQCPVAPASAASVSLQLDSDSEDGMNTEEEDEEDEEEDEEMGRTTGTEDAEEAEDAADSDDSDETRTMIRRMTSGRPSQLPPPPRSWSRRKTRLLARLPPRSHGAKRAAPPPKPPPAKQPCHSRPLRPVQPALLPQCDAPAPQASPTLETLAAPAAAAAAVVPASQQLAQLEARLGVTMQPGATPVQRVENMEALLEVTAARGLPTRVGALVAAADAQGL
eukprot:scaffold63929_cov65-Phaeocystis_antarctica.AAC.1